MITSLRLQHFRSYNDASFEFDPGVTIIVGPNASGKTNLLEAVLVSAHGSSYRTKDAELVQFEAPWARLDAQTPTHTRIVKLQGADGIKKSFEIDGAKLVRLAQQRTIPVVLFEPNHLLLLSGSPELRRSFLDELIEQTTPGFTSVRRHYKRVLAQRNSLLKKNPPNLKEQLFVWNLRLSELGGQIARERAKLIEHFNQHVSELYDSLAGRDNRIELQYLSKFNPETYETSLLKKLEEHVELEVLRGFTAYGPHRDDIVALIDSHPMQEAASRGETRTLVLALKILELQLLEQARQEKPILLLDDVFSELDAKRRQALTQFVQTYQTFITTTDADIVADYFAQSHKIIDLSA